MLPLLPPTVPMPDVSAYTQLIDFASPLALADISSTTKKDASVPFYSQFKDISSSKWQKVGCGITSLAMILDYYSDEDISVNSLLKEGIRAGAYENNAGWTYDGLIFVAKKHGMNGTWYDMRTSTGAAALAEMEKFTADGPVIASVHYKLDPKNPIPHLIVVTAVVGSTIHYNDPAAKSGDKTITTKDFLNAWKKRFIIVRPGAPDAKTA